MLGTKQDFLDKIKQKLSTELAPSFLDITDDSHMHEDHFAGSDLHLTLTICTAKFDGLSKVQQHQLIYQILGDYIGTNKGIHALRIITQ
jgi:BolA protein